MRYNITCQSCGSVYTADRIDNCKHCGSPVAIRDIQDNRVLRTTVRVNEHSPMVIERMDDPFEPFVTRFRAYKWVDGQKVACEIMVSDHMMVDANFNVREYIERHLRHKIADYIANQTEVVYDRDLGYPRQTAYAMMDWR